MEIIYKGPDSEIMSNEQQINNTSEAAALKNIAIVMDHRTNLDSVTIIFNETIEPPKSEGLYSSLLHSKDMVDSALSKHVTHRQRCLCNNVLHAIKTLLNDYAVNVGILNDDTQHIETETD